MAISWTSICNMALAGLGINSISNIDTDTTTAAIKCRAIYENTRDMLLRGFDWRFAIKRAELSQLDSTPEFGFDYEYTLPTSPYCLRVLNMEDDAAFEIEGRKLLTDEDECKIRYISRVTNPSKLDALFVSLMVCSIKAQLAIPLTNSGTLKTRMDGELKGVMMQARFANASEGMAENRDKNESEVWVDAGR